MVYIIHNCECGSCLGSSLPPRTTKGEMVFGGRSCNCSCHTLKGEERGRFLKMKEDLGLYV